MVDLVGAPDSQLITMVCGAEELVELMHVLTRARLERRREA